MHRDTREHVLIAFVLHQIAIFQGRLAKFGQQRITAAIHMNLDAAFVLLKVAHLDSQIAFFLLWGGGARVLRGLLQLGVEVFEQGIIL